MKYVKNGFEFASEGSRIGYCDNALRTANIYFA